MSMVWPGTVGSISTARDASRKPTREKSEVVWVVAVMGEAERLVKTNPPVTSARGTGGQRVRWRGRVDFIGHVHDGAQALLASGVAHGNGLKPGGGVEHDRLAVVARAEIQGWEGIPFPVADFRLGGFAFQGYGHGIRIRHGGAGRIDGRGGIEDEQVLADRTGLQVAGGGKGLATQLGGGIQQDGKPFDT